MTSQKGIVSIFIILIIVGLLLVGGEVWYWKNKNSKKESANEFPDVKTNIITADEDQYYGWKEYADPRGFKIKYPSTWFLYNPGALVRIQSWPNPNNNTLVPGEGGALTILVAEDTTFLHKSFNLEEWIKKYKMKPNYSFMLSPENKDVFIVKNEKGKESFFAAQNGYIYELKAQDFVKKEDEKLKPTVSLILKSFKTIKPENTLEEEIEDKTSTFQNRYREMEIAVQQVKNEKLKADVRGLQTALNGYKAGFGADRGHGKYPDTVEILLNEKIISGFLSDDWKEKIIYTSLKDGQDYEMKINLSTGILIVRPETEIPYN